MLILLPGTILVGSIVAVLRLRYWPKPPGRQGIHPAESLWDRELDQSTAPVPESPGKPGPGRFEAFRMYSGIREPEPWRFPWLPTILVGIVLWVSLVYAGTIMLTVAHGGFRFGPSE